MALIKDQQLSCSHAATPEMRFTDWVSGGSDAGDAVLANGADDLPSLLAQAEKLSMIAIEFDTFADGRGFSMARMATGRHPRSWWSRARYWGNRTGERA